MDAIALIGLGVVIYCAFYIFKRPLGTSEEALKEDEKKKFIAYVIFIIGAPLFGTILSM